MEWMRERERSESVRATLLVGQVLTRQDQEDGSRNSILSSSSDAIEKWLAVCTGQANVNVEESIDERGGKEYLQMTYTFSRTVCRFFAPNERGCRAYIHSCPLTTEVFTPVLYLFGISLYDLTRYHKNVRKPPRRE